MLAACSDYFRAMFTDPMKERNQNEINLSGVDAHGLELVLDYIYTSKLSLNLANIQTVLSTATHLQIIQVNIELHSWKFPFMLTESSSSISMSILFR